MDPKGTPKIVAGKRPYATPTLTSFGDLRRLTAGTKGGVKGDGPDNPSGPATRTVS